LLTFGGLVAGLVLAGWLARRQLRFGTPDTAVLGDVLIRAASKGDVVMMVLCREHHLEVVQAAGVAEREAHARFPGCRLLAPDSSDTPHAYQRVAHVAKWLGLSQAHLPQLVVFGPMAGFQARAALGRNSTSDSEQAVDAITVKLGSTYNEVLDTLTYFAEAGHEARESEGGQTDGVFRRMARARRRWRMRRVLTTALHTLARPVRKRVTEVIPEAMLDAIDPTK
jgi:hypothetical protein